MSCLFVSKDVLMMVLRVTMSRRHATRNCVMNAAELLVKTHPLHAALKLRVGGKPLTKRQARKFLQSLPHGGAAYKKEKVA